ncbi:MAG TPA: VOC family protein [Bacillales bacterium]|nr:VOC family protein [Bacillales bacterium]
MRTMDGLFKKIDTVRVPVRDIERSADWYKKQLGMQILEKNTNRAELKVYGGETMMVLERVDSFSPMDYLDRRGLVTHFNFNTLDAELAHMMLKDKGIQVTDIWDEDFLKYFAFRDLDGNVLSVCYEKEHSMFYQPITKPEISLFERVEAVFILVRDLPKMLAWYRRLPGLKLLKNWTQGADLSVGNGETIITLIQMDDFTPGQNLYFEFATAEMEKTHAFLKQMGTRVSEIKHEQLLASDPEGNQFGVRVSASHVKV